MIPVRVDHFLAAYVRTCIRVLSAEPWWGPWDDLVETWWMCRPCVLQLRIPVRCRVPWLVGWLGGWVGKWWKMVVVSIGGGFCWGLGVDWLTTVGFLSLEWLKECWKMLILKMGWLVLRRLLIFAWQTRCRRYQSWKCVADRWKKHYVLGRPHPRSKSDN